MATSLQFPDIGNALAQGYQIRALRDQSDERDRRKSLAPDVQAAIGGDSGALGRIAGVDPDYALKIGPIMEAMDAKQRAKTQAGADYTYKAANAVLQADPASRPAIYQQMIAEGRAQGHDLSRLPQQYTPGLEGQLRSWRQMAIPILEQWKREESQPVPMGGSAAGGAAPTPTPAPAPGGGGQYGGAIAGIESRGQPNNGYGAVGPVANSQGNRAYGRYQVLDSNIGPWTQEILGKPMTTQEFLANPQAQDRVFQTKFDQYVKQFGSPEAASRAWFGGPGSVNNPNASDVNGTTVANYERKFSAGMGGPPPAQMPGPPGGIAPPVQTAQMPGPPQNLIPPGPPPAQMPGAPPQAAPRVPGPIAAPPTPAQGDTPQADASGTPLPQQGGPPPPPNEMLQEFVQRVRPGWTPMVDRVTRQPVYDHAGRLMVGGPNNARDTIAVPKQAEVPFGWAPNGQGGFTPAPGGPHDPATIKTQAEAKRTAILPPGYQPNPAGSGLAPIPGGPEDLDVLTRKAEAKRIAAEKAIPQTVTKGMQENVNSLKQLDRVEAELTKHEASVGGVGSTAAAIIPGVGALQNRFGDPEGTQLRALIADIGSMKIHDRSGAAVTASEFPRLRPFIPTISDDAKTVRSKLANFRAEYTSLLADTASYYGPENGFRAYTPATDYLEGKTKGEPGTPPATKSGAEKARDDFNTKKATPPAGGGSLSMPRLSPQDAAKLPSGTPFVGEDGIPRVKH